MVKKFEKEIAVSFQPIDPKADSPFAGLAFAGELDEVLDLPFEITMNTQWIGYLNGRVLTEFNRLHPGRLSFLRFLPDREQGMVIMVPTQSEEDYGATPIVYSATENAAEVNLRLAVKRLNVVPQEGRVHQFQVVTRQADNGSMYLAFMTKGATTRPSRKRSKSTENSSTAAPKNQGETEQKQG